MEHDESQLASDLLDGAPKVYRRAAQICAARGTPAAVMAHLIGALRDPQERRRRAAARALGDVGDRDALPELERMAREDVAGYAEGGAPGSNAAGDIAWDAITRIWNRHGRTDEDLRRLVGALGQPEPAWRGSDRGGTTMLLVYIGAPAVGPLLEAAEHPDDTVRLKVADALGHIRDPRAVAGLLKLLGDPQDAVRSMAKDRLVNQQSWELLLPALEHPTPHIRCAVAELLARHAHRRGIGAEAAAQARDVAVACLRDPDPSVRASAARAVKLLVLGQRFHGDQPLGGRPSANELDWVAPAVPPLVACLGDANTAVRAAAVGALDHPVIAAAVGGSLAAPAATAALLACLRDPAAPIRAAAARALGRLGAEAAVRPLLDLGRADPDRTTRREALAALGWLESAEAIEPLVAALADPELCVVAVQALTSYPHQPRIARALAGLLLQSSLHETDRRIFRYLERYGDQHALPALQAAHQRVVRGDVSPWIEQAIAAIEARGQSRPKQRRR